MFVVPGQERTLDDTDERIANETRSTQRGRGPVSDDSVCGGEAKRNAARAVGRPSEDRRRRNEVKEERSGSNSRSQDFMRATV
jgi:hypothetical protein